MNIPQITPDNYKQVYKETRQLKISRAWTKVGHLVTRAALRPNTTWSEGVEEKVRDHIRNGGQILLIANHTCAEDIPVLPALLHKESTLKPMIGNTSIISKPDNVKHPVVRWLFHKLGLVQVMRAKEMAGMDADNKRSALEEFNKTIAKRANEGGHIAGYGEGTRNDGNPFKVQDIHTGIFHGVLSSKVADNFMTLPVGIGYGEKRHKFDFNAHVRIGEPILMSEVSVPADLAELVHDNLQEAVTYIEDHALAA